MQAVPRVIHVVASDITASALAALEATRGTGTPPTPVMALGPGLIPLAPPVRRIHPLCIWTPQSPGTPLWGSGSPTRDAVAWHAWSPRAARWCVGQARSSAGVTVHVLSAALAEDAVVWPVSGRLADTPRYVCYTRPAAVRVAAAGVAGERIVYQPHQPCLSAAAETRTAARHAGGLTPDDFAVLVLPPLERRNNAFVAVWATLLLEKLHPQARLLLAGGGREHARLVRLMRACRHTHLLPTATPQNLADLLAMADIAVHLPAAGGDTWALTQAVAYGCPLVATDTPELREVVPPALMRTTRGTPADVTRALAAVYAARGAAARRTAAHAQQ